MDKTITGFLADLSFGQVQVFKNMAAVPIFLKSGKSPEYYTLKEAMDMGMLSITELDSSGSVPELKAVNSAKMPVLILDGEEIVGAKQNRVLNTTVLLKEESETIIPVSCTEQGRWHYTSNKFSDSDVVTAHKVRLYKNLSVNQSLDSGSRFRSDQGRVWDEINQYQMAAGTRSATGAMKDIFTDKKESLDNYLNAFKLNEGQNGIFIFLKGKAVGFDYVSLSTAYSNLHLKLLKSYAIDAVLQNDGKEYEVKESEVIEFMDRIKNSNDKSFESVGYGRDFRFTGKGVIGSSLVWNDCVIHMACFKMDDTKVFDSRDTGNMSGYRRRMDNRIY